MINFFIILFVVFDLFVVFGYFLFCIDISVYNNYWCFDKGEGDFMICVYWIVMDIVFSSVFMCNLVVIFIDCFLVIIKFFEY